MTHYFPALKFSFNNTFPTVPLHNTAVPHRVMKEINTSRYILCEEGLEKVNALFPLDFNPRYY